MKTLILLIGIFFLALPARSQDVLDTFPGVQEGDTSVAWEADVPPGWELEKGDPVGPELTGESLRIQSQNATEPVILSASPDLSRITGDQYKIVIPLLVEKASGGMTLTFASYANFATKSSAWSWCVLGQDNKWVIFDRASPVVVPSTGPNAINISDGRNYVLTIVVDRATQTYSARLSDGTSEFASKPQLYFRDKDNDLSPHFRLTFSSKQPEGEYFSVSLGTITIKKPNSEPPQ